MRAAVAMTREVIVIRPDFPLRYAWELMQEHHIRHLPVVLEGALLGMLSDRDVLKWSTADADGELEVPEMIVRAAMSSPVETCERETSVSHIAILMTERKIDALPVLDHRQRLVGLVTSSDLLLLLVDPDREVRLPFNFEVLAPYPPPPYRSVAPAG